MTGIRRYISVSVPADWAPALVLEYALERIHISENRRNRHPHGAELVDHTPAEDLAGHHRWRVSYLSAPRPPA